jgi:transposase-like protein
MKEHTPLGLRERMGLVALGIAWDGSRKVIDYYFSEKGESQNSWVKFLGMIYQRGMVGDNL